MQPMRVFGIDCGTEVTGFGVVESCDAGRQPKVKKWVPKAEREKKAAKKIVKKVAKKATKSKVAKRAKK